MAISVVQTKAATGSGSTLSATLSSATTAGNCLVVCVMANSNSGTPSVSGVTIGGSASNFALIQSTTSNRTPYSTGSFIWACPNCPGGQTAISVSGSNFAVNTGYQAGIVVYEVSGLATSIGALLDQYSTNTGTSGNWTTGSTGTTANVSEFVVGCAADLLSTLSGPGGPWTNTSPSSELIAGRQVSSATGTFKYNGTGANTTYSAVLVTLNGPPTGGTATLTVTATSGGGAVNGITLGVEVLDAAALPSALNTGTQTASSSQAANTQINPAFTGSLIYSVVGCTTGTTPAAHSGNTSLGTSGGHGLYVSTAAQVANTPFTAGSTSSPTAGSMAGLEVTPLGGTISTDASTPPVVNATGATTVSTGAFTPPSGSVLMLAMVSAIGGSGQVSASVKDSYGLTWTQAIVSNTAGDHYAGIFYAYTPSALAVTSSAAPAGTVGSAYSYQIPVTGGWGGDTFVLATGSLPAGLMLSSSGVLFGTPTTAGFSTFTVTVTDTFGGTATSGAITMVVNKGTTPGGTVVATWSGSAAPYSYGTLEIPVANIDHDWLFVSVSWEDSEDMGIAYVADDVRNVYQQGPLSSSGAVNTQVFIVPNAGAASVVYVSVSAFVRYLTAVVLDVNGLEPGYTVDASNTYSGTGTSLAMFLGTTTPDFVLASGAFAGTPNTAITQSGTGATWTAAGWAGINGTGTGAGLTQAASWASPGAGVPWLDGEIASESPLAWWKLSDGSGSGTAADSSGNGHSGTATSVTFANASAPSPPDTSASFASASTSHVLSTYNPSFAAGLTVEAWVNYNSLSQGTNNPRLVANSHTDSDHNGFQLMVSTAGQPQFWVGNGTTAGNAAGGSVPSTGWTHIAGTYDGTNVRVYVNGTLQTTTAFTGNVTAGSGSGIGLGYGTAYAGDYLNGLLAEAAVYGTVLSGAQIAAHAAAGVTSLSVKYSVASSAAYAGCMVAVYSDAGLPVNANPAWPVTSVQAAFGYTPQEPTALPVWTDITGRYRGLGGSGRGRNFQLDEITAADLELDLDNFDGALSPGGSYGADLITPVRVLKTWQGRAYSVFQGEITALPQTYDFQRGLIKASVTDGFSKLSATLVQSTMIQEMLYDKPLDLWALNDQQGSTVATNWSGRSNAYLTPLPVTGGGSPGIPSGLTVPPNEVIWVTAFGRSWPTIALPVTTAGTGGTGKKKNKNTSPPTLPQTPTTGFGNTNSGTYPAGLAGTQDSTWGNTTTLTASTFYQGTVLQDSNDSTLPLTSTGATYSVWAQMYYVPSNANATLIMLSDQSGSPGTNMSLSLSYNGSTVTVAQTTGSATYTPAAYLFDSKWHLWTVTISTAGVVTTYLDGTALGSYTATMPSGAQTLLQFGGDATAVNAPGAGIFTGQMYLAGAYDRVVDPERIATWAQSGITGFLNELGGARIQRVLGWARWSAPQGIDPGVSMQQAFSYLTGGYGSSGLSGSLGNYATAGGAAGVDSGAQADVTIQDIANTENGFLWMASAGGLYFRQRTGSFPSAIPAGDMDWAFNETVTFADGLGDWTTTASCTVAQSTGWSYSGQYSGLMTVTGTPTSASVNGAQWLTSGSSTAGFSVWVMSPQGCYAQATLGFYATGYLDQYQANYTDPYGVYSGGAPVGTATSPVTWCPPMTPVHLLVPSTAAPGGTLGVQGTISIVNSPATGAQLYFDRARLSPAGFQAPFNDDIQLTEDIQFLYNDVAITRNVDQVSYRARDVTSRSKYYPRIYTRTIYSSPDDVNALPSCGNLLVSAFAYPAIRVAHMVIDAAENPEAWPFVLSADIGDVVQFTRSPVGAPTITGPFTLLSVQPDLAPDKAQFTYTLAPLGVY